MSGLKLLGISGSLRRESHNTKLVNEAARLFGESDFTLANIKFPLFNEDDEISTGIPEDVQRLTSQIEDASAIIISTPEYDGSVPGVLKNALDWVSRVEGKPWSDKPVAIMSATAGRTGGATAQYALRLCLVPFRVRIVAGPTVLVAGAKNQFDEFGRLLEGRYIRALSQLMAKLRESI